MKGLSPEDFDKLRRSWQPGRVFPVASSTLSGGLFAGALGLGSGLAQAESTMDLQMRQMEQRRAMTVSPSEHRESLARDAERLVWLKEKKRELEEERHSFAQEYPAEFPDDRTVLEKLVDKFEEWTEDIFDFSYLDDVKVNPYEEKEEKPADWTRGCTKAEEAGKPLTEEDLMMAWDMATTGRSKHAMITGVLS